MKIVNQSQFPVALLSDLFQWGREALNVNHDAVQIFRVYGYKKERGWRGTAFRQKKQIIIRVAASTWCYPTKPFQYRGGPFVVLRDCYDALGYVLLHELAHFKDWQLGNPRTRDLEARVERLAKPIVDRFKAERAELFWKWCYKPDPMLWLPPARPVAIPYCGGPADQKVLDFVG